MAEPVAAPPPEERAYRLPRYVVPSRYELTIEPDLEASTFTGTEDVTVEVIEPIDEVVLNALDLEVDAAWIVDANGARFDASVTIDVEHERARLHVTAPLAVGRATVHVAFRGVLNDKLEGFYRSTFTDEAGATRVIATTQMEPTDARRAFPCWDEPDLKAVFAVTLVVADGLLAVSNGGVVDQRPTGDGRTAYRFADTIPMSTYLVAFIVGPLEATAPVDVDGTPLRVVHVPGKGHLADYGLEVGAFCLHFFADWYDIAYPGDELDLIALPDFAAGAMENLGAITFREAVLLVDPVAVTRSELQRVADVVAHELAHMWFGDLVTMRWWNGLWLNEAFATFMELLAVDAFKPEWERWVSFSLERSAALDVDALDSTRPVEYPVRSPADAEGMFDVLTYQKGASVLRMLERYLGMDAFQAGIRRYLDARRYGNAETTDLWDAIEAASGQPVRRIMDSWIFQGGYPVVIVTPADGGVRLRQERFHFLSGRPTPAGIGTRWSIPLVVRVGDGADAVERRLLLEDEATTMQVSAGAGVVVNAGGHGFYRVRYVDELLERITERAHHDLSAMERYLLVDDAWAAVLAGHTSAATFLELARRFVDETDRTVWAVVLGALGQLDRILDDATRPRLARFVSELVAPAAERLGWEPVPGEDDLTGQLRGTLITALGVLADDEATQTRARQVHDAYRADHEAVDPNVAAAAVNVVAHTGSEDDYRRFVEAFRTSNSPQEQLRYLYALTAFPQPGLAEESLAMSLSSDIRTQNAPFVVMGLLQNRTTGAVAWRFLQREWMPINERFPGSSIPRLLGGVTALSTPELAAEVEAFLEQHPVPQGAKQVAQHLERLQVNVALRQREAALLADALA